MSRVLELPQLAQHHRPAERHVGGGGIEPELHPQRPTERELVTQAIGRHDLGGTGCKRVEIVGAHRERMLAAPTQRARAKMTPPWPLVPGPSWPA